MSYVHCLNKYLTQYSLFVIFYKSNAIEIFLIIDNFSMIGDKVDFMI